MEFEEYWAFEIFELLGDKDNPEKIENALQLYFKNLDNNIVFREESVLKRILTINFEMIKPEHRHRLLSGFYRPDFLSQLQLWHFRRIRERVKNDGDFFSILDNQINVIMFNSYHYQLLNFYKKDRKDFDLVVLNNRITELET